MSRGKTKLKPYDERLSKGDSQLVYDLRRVSGKDPDKARDALRALRYRVLRPIWVDTDDGRRLKWDKDQVRVDGVDKLASDLRRLMSFRRLSSREEAKERDLRRSFLTKERLLRMKTDPESFVARLVALDLDLGDEIVMRQANENRGLRWRIAVRPSAHTD